MPSISSREGVGELLDAFLLEHLDDVVVVDAGRASSSSRHSRLVDALVSVSPRTSPWSWKAAIVSAGIVLTVFGPISSST